MQVIDSGSTSTGSGAAIRQRRPYWARGWVLTTAVIIFSIVGGLALFLLPRHLLNEWLTPAATFEERNRALGVAAQVVLFALGGLIALVGVGVSLSRHGEELDAADRDRLRHQHELEKESRRRAEGETQRLDVAERAFRDRFITAIGLLSDDSAPTKRSAGIYALFALANDWLVIGREDEHQVCIDVVCGYLRSPISEGLSSELDQERAVRITAYRLLGQTLRSFSVSVKTGNLKLDLSGALIDVPVEWARVELSHGMRIYLRNSTIQGEGNLDMKHALLRDGAVLDASGLIVRAGGRISLHGSTVRSSRIMFVGCRVEDQGAIACSELKVEDGALVTFQRSKLSSQSTIYLGASVITAATLSLTRAHVAQHSRIVAGNAVVTEGGRVLMKRLVASEYGSVRVSNVIVQKASELLISASVDDTSRVVESKIQVDSTSSLNHGKPRSAVSAKSAPSHINVVDADEVPAIAGLSREMIEQFQHAGWVPGDNDQWDWNDVRRSAILKVAQRQGISGNDLARISDFTRTPRQQGHNVLVMTEESIEWVPRRLVPEYLDGLTGPVVFQISLRDIEPRMRIVQRRFASGVEARESGGSREPRAPGEDMRDLAE